MTPEQFKEKAANVGDDVAEIDVLCFAWLEDVGNEQTPRVRRMIRAAIEVIRKGIE